MRREVGGVAGGGWVEVPTHTFPGILSVRVLLCVNFSELLPLETSKHHVRVLWPFLFVFRSLDSYNPSVTMSMAFRDAACVYVSAFC